jgi:prepilin peptidase CpaA
MRHFSSMRVPMISIAYSLLAAALQLTFVFCICYAIVTDFAKLLIPNWISLVLVGTFAVFAALHVRLADLPGHLFVTLVIFGVSLAFFVAGWMGGGDVKFLTALALWMGPENVAPFVVMMALLGSVLAIGLLLMGRLDLGPRMQKIWIVSRLAQLAQERQCPYGVAIGAAGLLVSPGIFQPLGT